MLINVVVDRWSIETMNTPHPHDPQTDLLKSPKSCKGAKVESCYNGSRLRPNTAATIKEVGYCTYVHFLSQIDMHAH